MTYLTAGPGGAYQPAGSCPGAEKIMSTEYAAHHGVPGNGTFMVAEMTTRDKSASIRIALWRCQYCRTLCIGIAGTDIPIDGPHGAGVHNQEFTWLEEIVAELGRDV